MLDYTKLIKKIVPAEDGQDVLRLRTAVVDDVNADGTVDIILSGVLIENVPKMAEASIADGAVVQVLSYRGSLLVLGRVGNSSASPGLGLWARGDSIAQSAAIGTTLTTVLTTTSKIFRAGRVYEIRMFGGVSTATTGNSFADFRVFRTGPDTQLGEYYRTPIGGATNVYKAEGTGLRFTPGAVDVTGQLSLKMAHSSGTVQHYANATNPRFLEAWDVGDLTQFTNVPVW